MLNCLSKLLYDSARTTRDVNSVVQCFKRGSLMPLVRRVFNKWLGRNIIRRLWWRP